MARRQQWSRTKAGRLVCGGRLRGRRGGFGWAAWWVGLFPHEDNRKAHRLGLDTLGLAAVVPAVCVMPEARLWEEVMVIVVVLGSGEGEQHGQR